MSSEPLTHTALAEPPGFPFSAVVGQDELRLALILCAVHPGIGGVLVRGEKGTAKSTVVRALARLLPPVAGPQGMRQATLVELPVGATEDRVVGSIDLERVLRDGERAFQPGLLAQAHEGVLYVDEVNLLHDHLVDVLLDAAAMGRVHVERDGFSHTHAARFVLVGTMNPEEGELRPQLLDRFGLTVDVAASRDVGVRAEVIRRRLDYERDPDAFAVRFDSEDIALAERIAAAKNALHQVELPDREVRRIASLCAAFGVDGMRADLVMARTAMAHAAWRGDREVTEEDVRAAAELALPHRRRRDPFDEPGLDQEQLDEAMTNAAAEAGDDDPDPDDPPPGGSHERDEHGEHGEHGTESGMEDKAGSEEDSSATDSPAAQGPSRERDAALPASAFRARLLEVPGTGEGAPGRRSRARAQRGRIVRATPFAGSSLHLPATVLEAAAKLPARGGFAVRPSDLRGAEHEGREGNLVIFAVDASGSMAARDRLAAVTGAVVSLLRDAYQRRDKVAVITLRGQAAELVLPPTSSVDIAVRRLGSLRTGGRTPLAEGLLKAWEVVRRERIRDPQRRALVVLLTDGRATAGTDPVRRAQQAASVLARAEIASVTVDCEHGMIRLGLANELAGHLRGGYVRLAELSADAVTGVVRAAA